LRGDDERRRIRQGAADRSNELGGILDALAMGGRADEFTRDRDGQMVEPSPLRENSFSDDD
jgi:hypothetical protein